MSGMRNIDFYRYLKEMWEWRERGTNMSHSPYKIFTNRFGDTVTMYLNKNRIILAWDGSSNDMEWRNNFKAFPVTDGCHHGFEEAVAEMMPDIILHVHDIINIGLQNGVYYSIHQTSHSRGSAMACISEYRLRKAGFGSITTVTFGSPRPFTKKGFENAMGVHMDVCHVRMPNDPVDDVPPRWFLCRWIHAPGYVVELPTVKGKFDHLAFGEALDIKIKELEDGK